MLPWECESVETMRGWLAVLRATGSALPAGPQRWSRVDGPPPSVATLLDGALERAASVRSTNFVITTALRLDSSDMSSLLLASALSLVS